MIPDIVPTRCPDFFAFIPAYRASPTTYGKPFRPFSIVLRKTYGTPSFRKRKKLAFPENENIGLLWGKVPMFCMESTEVCSKEVRCFWFPEAVPHENCREWQCWVRCSRWCASSSIARRQTSPQKKFLKKTYISYTLSGKHLCMLCFSGVESDVG